MSDEGTTHWYGCGNTGEAKHAGCPRYEFHWLVEIAGPMYLSTARSNAGGGFTYNPHEAQKFPTKADAEAEIEKLALQGPFAAQAVEHGFIE